MMTKIAKKCFLAMCSFMFVLCFGIVGVLGLNTNKTIEAKAANEPTVTFTGLGTHNNDAWNGNTTFVATYLTFSGDFGSGQFVNSGTPTDANGTNAQEGIYYTNPQGTTVKFNFIWVESPLNTIELIDFGTKTTIGEGSVLHVVAGTEFCGQVLPEVTLTMGADGNWIDPNAPAPVAATFAGILGQDMSGTIWGSHSLLHLGFDQTLATEAVTLSDSNLNGALMINGEPATGINLMAKNFYADGNSLEVLFKNKKASDFAEGTILHIAEGALFNGFALSEVTLVYNGSAWEVQVLEPTAATFTGILGQDLTGTVWGAHSLLHLGFDQTLATVGVTLDDSNLDGALTINGEPATGINLMAKGFNDNGNSLEVLFKNSNASSFAEGTILHIAEGALFNGFALSEVTLVYNGSAWEVSVPDPIAATFTGILGQDLTGTVWGAHSLLHLGFDQTLATVGVTLEESNLNGALTIDGQPATGINLMAKGFNANGNSLEVLFKNSNASSFAEGTMLHIEEGALFNGFALSEVTLVYNGSAWEVYVPVVDPTEVSFEGIPEYNNAQPFGDNGYYMTSLQFSEALYGADDESAESKTYNNANAMLNAIAGNIKINGVNGVDLGLKLHGDSSGNINFQVPVAKVPVLSEDCEQVVLTIDEGTTIGNYILPKVTLYLNAATQWQVEEYTYIPPEDVTFEGIPEYNNAQPFGDNGYYMTSLKFSEALYGADDESAEGKTYNNANAMLNAIAGNIKINGVNGVDLGLKLHGDSSGNINFQVPVANLLALKESSRQVVLTIDEGTMLGHYRVTFFRLHLDELNKWQLIDETDKTAPVITYEGETEIDTSAEKPFIITVSAFDHEDGKECVVYYVWSEGALDENNKLVKGTHTCTITATDIAGNEATLILTVNVGDKDTEAPVITVADTINALAGAKPEFAFEATDNMDEGIVCEVAWSEGALDEEGNLVAGEHTMTLTATDLTGNVTTKTVTVIVASLDLDDEGDSTPDDSTNETPDNNDSSSGTTSNDDSSSVGSSDTDSTGGCFGGIESTSLTVFLAMMICVGLVVIKRKKNNE